MELCPTTPQYGSYWKGILWCTLDKGHRLYIPKSICQWVNLMVWLEFELVYVDVFFKYYSLVPLQWKVEDKYIETIVGGSAFRLIHHHHHHVLPLARISLNLSRHFSQSFITSGRSSGLHPLSSHSCCMF